MNEFERRLKDSLIEVRDASQLGASDRRSAVKQELFRRMRRRRILVTTGGVVLAGAAAVGAFVLFSSLDRSPVKEPKLGPVEIPAPARAVVEVGDRPRDLSVGGLRFVWAANVGDNTVSRIDPRTNEVVVTVELESEPGDIAIGTGPVWVALPEQGTIVEINPNLGVVAGDPLVITEGPVGDMELTVGAGALWVVVTGEHVVRVDLATLDQKIIEAAPDPTDVAVKKDVVRVLDGGGAIYLVDPLTGEEVADPLEVAPSGDGDITLAAGSLWYFAEGGETLSRLDPVTGEVISELDPAGTLVDFVIDPEVAWALTRSQLAGDPEPRYLLTPIDVATNGSGESIQVEGEPVEAVIAGRSLWLSLTAEDIVLRFSKFR